MFGLPRLLSDLHSQTGERRGRKKRVTFSRVTFALYSSAVRDITKLRLYNAPFYLVVFLWLDFFCLSLPRETSFFVSYPTPPASPYITLKYSPRYTAIYVEILEWYPLRLSASYFVLLLRTYLITNLKHYFLSQINSPQNITIYLFFFQITSAFYTILSVFHHGGVTDA